MFTFHKNFYDCLETDNFETVYPESGGRFYKFNGNLFESVTTFLGRTNPEKDDILDSWRERIGADEADKITKKAANKGTAFHNACEKYVLKNELSGNPHLRSILPFFKKFGEIHKIEGFLYSEKLKLAGRTDCIAEYDGKLSVIDYKNTRKMKRKEWITDYFLQLTIYGLMYYERYGVFPQQGVILMSDGFFSEEFVVNLKDYVPMIVERKARDGKKK